MDRFIQSPKKKTRVFKQFESIDLIPYSLAFILLLAELYILCSFIGLSEQLGRFKEATAF
jgi:hypothetical protein